MESGVSKEKLFLGGYKYKVYSEDPYLIVLESFLSDKEISDILKTVKDDQFQRSYVVEGNTGSAIHKDRTSSSAMLGRSSSETVRNIETRVNKIFNLSNVAYQEPYQLVRYGPGQKYSPHFDYFIENIPWAKKEVAERGQRVATILAYLQEPDGGGDTVFPRLGIRVPPKKGTAVLWFDMDGNGNVDPRTEHGGAEVSSGVKIAMNIWIRTKLYN